MSVFNNLPEGFPVEGFGGQEPTQTEQTPTTETTPIGNPPPEGGQGIEPTGDNAADWQKEYKSPEEMYEALKKTKTSYENIRPAYTKVTQELSLLRKNATTPTSEGAANTQTTQQTQTTQTQQPNPVNEILNHINKAIEPVAEMRMQLEVRTMMEQNPDFAELAPAVKEILKEDPELWHMRNPLQFAYEIAKGRNIKTKIEDIAKDVKDEAYSDKHLKVVGSGGSSKPAGNTKPLSEEEQTVADILEVSKRRSSIF